jgi:hypothetical protein
MARRYLGAAFEKAAAMHPDTYARITRGSGLGLGWTKVVAAVAEAVPTESIDRIWLFAPVRRDEREWGTAVLSCRTEEERRRIYTASYLMVVRGRERGRGKVTVEEVGVSPPDVVHEVIAGVQERAGEASPPAEISPTQWFADDETGPDRDSSEVHEVGTEPRSADGPVTSHHSHEATER